MNKKGFTLTELLAVIVILGILITLASASVISVMVRVNNNMYDAKIKEIASFAEKYAAETNSRIFFADKLVKEGYIEPDDEEGYIKSPKDKNKFMNCYPIEVEHKNGQYYATVFQDSSEYEKPDHTCSEDSLAYSDKSFALTSTNPREITLTCPIGTDIILVSNNGYYGYFECNASPKYIPITLTRDTTFTATFKQVDGIVKSRQITLKYE